MPESPPLFSFGVPACASFLQSRPGSADRKYSDPRYGRNRGNKARMSMKTKGLPGIQPPLAPPNASRAFPDSPARMRRGGGTLPAWRETGFTITKTAEQTQNVYENKRQVQNVAEPQSSPRRTRTARLAPRALKVAADSSISGCQRPNACRQQGP